MTKREVRCRIQALAVTVVSAATLLGQSSIGRCDDYVFSNLIKYTLNGQVPNTDDPDSGFVDWFQDFGASGNLTISVPSAFGNTTITGQKTTIGQAGGLELFSDNTVDVEAEAHVEGNGVSSWANFSIPIGDAAKYVSTGVGPTSTSAGTIYPWSFDFDISDDWAIEFGNPIGSRYWVGNVSFSTKLLLNYEATITIQTDFEITPPTLTGGDPVPVPVSGRLPTPPTGGFGVITIFSNVNMLVESGDNTVGTGIENYGILTQTGGNLSISGPVNLYGATYDDGTTVVQTGVFNLSNGTATFVSLHSDTTANQSIGGVVNQSGGTLTTGNFTQTGNTTLDASHNQYVGGVYNLSGGTASLGIVTNNGIINQSGGNLTATSLAQTDSTFNQLTISNSTPVFTLAHFGVFNQTGGTSSLGNVTGNGTISIGANATMTAASLSMAGGSLTANGTVTVFNTSATRGGTGVVINLGNLSIGSNGTLDITNHDLIVRNSNLTTINNEILNGYGVGSGGASITSSTSLVNGTTFLVPLDTTALSIASWDGIATTDPNIIVVKYTYFGDATLDGIVNGDDYSVIAGNFGHTTPGLTDIEASWLLGDVTLDGIVDGNDFSAEAGNAGASPLFSAPAPTPEPASLCIIGLGTLALLGRRRPK